MKSTVASLLVFASIAALLPGHALGGTNPRHPSSCSLPDSVLRSGSIAPKGARRDKEVGRSSPSASEPTQAAQAPVPAPVNAMPADSARPVSRYHPPDAAQIDSLKRGGYVIVFRHGRTDWGQRDAAVIDFADRSAQRNLSDIGRKESAEIGRALAGLRIPIGSVLASPMWRCRDTAMLAFGKCDTTIDLFQRGKESRDARLRMLSTRPTDGTNTVLVTHQDVLLPIMALRRDELGEGEALLVKPLGNGAFVILAQATLADWIRFLPARKL